MNDAQVNALLSALENQRNAAMNGLANTQAELTVAKATITALQKELIELKTPKPTPEALPA